MRRCSLAAAMLVIAAGPLAAEQGREMASAASGTESGRPSAAETRPAPDRERPSRAADGEAITLVIVGDTGLGGSLQPVRPDTGLRHGKPIKWTELTSGIASEIDGDFNFANLETVVTDRNDIAAADKAFSFRTHPAGVRHLVETGFNLLSTANNHAIDFGERGIRETLRHLDAMSAHGLLAHAGLAEDRDAALEPKAATAKGARVLLSAIGIGAGAHRADDDRPGQLSYSAQEDFADVVARLAKVDGAYRMLSVHYGMELQVAPDAADVRKLRDQAVRAAGIDLVIGHHAHVAAGVQEVGGKLIFYGLGNFLHLGMQDMSSFDQCRDYGLMARIHLARGADGRLVAQAVEAVPLTGMHARTERMAPKQAAQRVRVLNHLAGRLDDASAGARGVRFAVQPDGAGLYCTSEAASAGGRIGELCRGWIDPRETADAPARGASVSCGNIVSSARKSRPAAEAAKTQSSNPFAALFGF